MRVRFRRLSTAAFALSLPNWCCRKPLRRNDLYARFPLKAARIEALTITGQPMRHKFRHNITASCTWMGRQIGKQSALSWLGIKMISVMFKITQSTLRDFTLTEVLLMAAMNQLEAKRNVGGNARNMRDHCQLRAKAA